VLLQVRSASMSHHVADVGRCTQVCIDGELLERASSVAECLQIIARIQAPQVSNNQPRPTALGRVCNMLAQENVKADERPVNAATCTIPSFSSIVCIWLIECYPFSYLIRTCITMHNEHQTLRLSRV